MQFPFPSLRRLVLSHNMSTINTTSNWLRFGAFLSPSSLPLQFHWPLAPGYCSCATDHHSPLATRHFLQIHWPLFSRRPPGPAGSGHAQTLPRWLLPSTDRPGSREVLLPPRPLRTGRESCPSSSSSIH